MNQIDFVITWVDGNDPEWQAQKAIYSGKDPGDARAKRYRDWDMLRYWFRGVEQCAPWVRKIHFVTCGHLPPWLDASNPKLNIVNHKDYIPEQYLPTFSCRPIELNIHRIPDLSDDFVYFNDDMFLLKAVKEEDFFHKGLPVDMAVVQASYLHGEDANGEVLKPENYNTSNIYNIPPINRHFNKRRTIMKNFSKWFTPKYGFKWIRTLVLMPFGDFTGFLSTHLPYAYRKKTFEEVWEKESMLLERACEHRFRDSTDVSSRLFSFWQFAKGDFYPRGHKEGRYFAISNDPKKNRRLAQVIEKHGYRFICINDEYTGDDFEGVKKKLLRSFERAFPEKSSFEAD